MKVRIEIDTKTLVRFWLVVIGFILLGFAIWQAKDAIILLVISAFLALALNAPVSRIAKILPGSNKNRVGATAVAYLLMIVILATITSFIAPTVIDQTNKFISNAPQIVADVTAENSSLRKFVETNNLKEVVNKASQSMNDFSEGFTKNIGNILFGSLSTVVNWIFSLFMILTMTFLMLVEGPSWLHRFWKLYSDREKQKRHKRIASRMYKAVSSFVNGQLTVCAISGTLGALVVLILSFTMHVPINLAIPVGVILLTLGLIPMFGATIAGVISALIIAFNVPFAGAVFIVYFIVYQQIENNVISPLIQAKNNQLSALIVVVAITTGIYVLGILGALLSIPIAACTKIMIEEYFARKCEEQKEPTKDAIIDFLKKIG